MIPHTHDVTDHDSELVRLRDEVTDLRCQVEQLRQGLVSRTEIGTAVGILAGRLGIGSDHAWDALRWVSATTNVKVREVARVIVECQNGGSEAADEQVRQAIALALGDPQLRRETLSHGVSS